MTSSPLRLVGADALVTGVHQTEDSVTLRVPTGRAVVEKEFG